MNDNHENYSDSNHDNNKDGEVAMEDKYYDGQVL